MSTPALTLIGSARFRPFRNAWMLLEMKIPFTYNPVGPRSDILDQTHPYKSGKVPLLQDGNFTISESVAINTYLGIEFTPCQYYTHRHVYIYRS
eukprot:m.34044 g.34044  ORF g.34044 m.34044 type:complete len:94 (-) comp8657_c0_seq2:835-1116(-)